MAALRRIASGTLAAVLTLQPVLAEAGQGYYFRLNGIGTKHYLTIRGPARVFGHMGSGVSARYVASDGMPPYLWGAANLPDSLSIDGSGAISGLPKAPGLTHAAVVASDDGGASATYPIDVMIYGELEVVGVADLETGVGVENATVVPVATGNPVGHVSWTLAAGSPPPGMSVDAETGAVKGVPGAVGTYTMSVQATDETGASAISASYTIKVDDVLDMTSKGPINLAARVGVPYRSPTPSVGGAFKAPGKWSVTSPTLPDGLVLDEATGVISGTAKAVMPKVQLVEGVVDAGNRMGTLKGTIAVLPALAFPPDDGEDAYVGWFRQGVQGRYAAAAPSDFLGGEWSVASGSLPAYLRLDPAGGAVTGAPARPLDPTVEQDVTLTLAIKEAGSGATATTPPITFHMYGPLTLGYEPDLVGTFELPMASPAVPVTGLYAGKHAWDTYATPPQAPRNIPGDLRLDGQTGALGGTPTTGYAARYKLAVTDKTGTFPTNEFLVSSSPKFTLSNLAGVTGRQGMPLAVPAPVVSAGHDGAVTFTTLTPLPKGLSIGSASGRITGTPTETPALPADVVVVGTDAVGYASQTPSFRLVILPPLSVTLGKDATLGSLVKGDVDFATHPGFQVSIPVSLKNSPKGPVTWSPDAIGALPAGLRFTPSSDGLTGTIGGSLSKVGDQAVTLSASDADGASALTTLTAHVVPPVSAAGPSFAGRVGVPVKLPLGCDAKCAHYGSTTAAVASNAIGGVTWYPADDGSFLPAGMGYEVSIGRDPSYTGLVIGSPGGPDGTYQLAIGVADALDTPTRPSRAISSPGTGVVVKALDISPTPVATVTDHAGVALTPTPALSVSNDPVGKVTFAVTGDMPPGVDFSTTTGVFSGKPTVPGDWTVRVSAFDAQNETTPAYVVKIHVDNAIQVGDGSPIADYTAREGVALFAPPTPPAILNSTSPPFDWALTPPVGGIALDPSGAMSGVPTGPGSTKTTYQVGDSQGALGYSVPFTVNVLPHLSLSATSATNYVTDVVSTQLPAPTPSPVTPLSWQVTGLPPGLTYDVVTGLISGSPTKAGTYDGQVAVNDAWGAPADATFHWVVYEQVVVDALASDAPSTYVGSTDYDLAPPTVENARGTVTWAADPANPAPPGLAVDPKTGHVTGVPTTAGSYAVAFQATDGGNFVAKGPAFRVDVRPPLAIAATDFLAREGVSFPRQVFAVTNGIGLKGLAVDPATPGWVTVSMAGQVSGTAPDGAAATSPFPLKVTVTDTDGETATATATARVLPPISIATIEDQDARVQTDFKLVVPTLGNAPVAPLTWATPALPPGLTFDPATQTISGKPTTAQTYVVQIAGRDAEKAPFSTNAFRIAVRGPLKLSLVGGPSYAAHQGSPASVAGPVIDGNPKEPLTVVACCSDSGPMGTDALPDGLGMLGAAPRAGAQGIGGVPTAIGSYPGMTFSIRDATGGVATSPPFTLTVNPPLALTAIADGHGRVGLASKQIQAPAVSGNPSAPLAWAPTLATFPNPGGGTFSCPVPMVAKGSATAATVQCYDPLPEGLTLDPTVGFVSGTPTTAGVYPERFGVRDAAGGSADTNAFTITIIDALAVAQGEPAKTRVHVGTPVNLPGLALLNGPVAPVTWTVASGTLPDGLSLDGPTGTVSGTPTGFNDGDKTSVLTLLATDAQGATFATDPFSLEVYGPLTLAAYADVETSVGHSEAQAPALTHAAPTASFAATGLPKGLSVDAGTGALSGAATELGTFQAVVTAIDGVGATATRSFAVTVRDTLGVASTTDQTARVGLSRVVAQAAAQNAVGTVTWSPAPGYAAPLGLSLDTTTGRLSGSPTTVGTTRYAFRAVDADGRVGLGAPFSVTVYSPLTIGAAGTFALRQDVPASVPAPSVGNTPAQPVAWTVAQGSAVPGNFTLDPVTGTVTGTPTAAQSNTVANMALTVTDAQGATISDNAAGQPAVLNFYPPLTVVTPGAQYGHVGQALSMAAPSVGSNPVAPTAWTAAVTLPDGTTSTSMPAGLALNAGTGAVTGTPTDAAVGVSTFRLTVRDATGGSVTTGPVSLTVRPAMTMAALSDYKVHDDVQHAFDVPAMTNASGTPSFVVASSPSGITPFVIATGQAGQRAGLAAATYAVTVTATDLSGATASRTFNALVAPPLALAAPASNAATYDVVSALPAPVASNVIGTATYGLASGTLPAGMTLATDTGVVSGTPTQVGTFPISLSVRDDTGTTAVSPSLNLIVSYVSASKTYPTTVTYNGTDAFGALWDASATSKVTTTSGGTLVATYADPVQFDGSVDTDLSTGAATLTYNSGTVASPVWKPVVAGTTYGAIQIREVTSAGYAPSRLRFGQAGAYPPSIQSISAATMTPFVGVAIAQDLDALMATANATGAKTWALASGSLPAGVTISGSQLVGTPTTPGLATFSLSVTDARGVASAPAVVTFNALSATLASNTYPSSVVDTGQAGDVTAAAYDNATATQLPSSLSISFPSVNGPSPTITYYTETFSFPASTTVSTIDVSSTELGTSPTVSYCSSDCGTASPTMTTIATTSSSGTVTLAYPISSNVFKVTGSAYLSPAGTTRYLTRERLGYAGAYPAALPSLTTTAALQRPVVGTAYSVALDALMATADTSGAETWRVVTGTLPPGLSLDPAGTVAGTPTTTGDYPVTLAVTDARGIASVAQPVTLSVQSNVQASTTYPASATSVGTGALATPVGTSNVASGVAAGYDGSAATAYPTVRANDGGDYAGVRYTFAQPVAWDGSVSSAPSAKALFYNVGTTASPTWKAWTSTVGVVTSTDFQVVTAGALTAARLGYGGSFPTYLPSVTGTKVRPVVGTPYSASLDSVLATQNGSGAETWAMTGGLPAGLTLDPVGGTISGTPTAIGDVSVTLAVTDARGIASTPATLILSVQSNVQASTVYPTGVVDVGAGSSNMAIPVATLYDASAATTLTNGSASSNGAVVTFAQPVSFDGSVDASPAATVAYNTGTAASPTWATWSAASGVVTSSQFKVTATSGFLARARIGYGGAYPASLPSLTATKDRPVVGTAYSASLDALMATANASGTEAWAMTGTLPAGLSFDPNAGTISGTPTATGDATVSLSVTDARGIASAPIALTLSVQSNVLASTAYPTTAGYMGDFAASPGNAISTTPVAATYDASSTTAAGGWNGYVNSAYSYGSNVTYTFAQPVSWDGSVSLQNASGYVTLWYLGPAGWTQWTSAAGAVTATRFAVVNNAPFSIAYLTGARLGYGGAYPAYLPSTTAASTQRPVVGAPYSVALDAVMGTTNASGPETWAVTAGTLPAGLSLDPVAGTISGTPTAVGDSTLTVTVTDSRGLPSVGATVTLSVQSNVLASTAYPSSFSSVGSTLLDAAYDNSAITTFSLGVNRGTPITFSYAQPVSFDGSVDTDLTSYQIYYVTPGGQSALWTATSGAVSTASISLLSTLPYYAVSPTVTRARLGYGGAYPAFLPSLTAGRDKPVVGTAYAGNLDAILAVANSSGGETWTLSSGTMPAGLTLDANGTVTGTPASSGDKTVTVSMTDVRGFATPPIALTLSVQSSVQASTVYPSSATSVACGAYNANCSTSTPVPVATTYDASLASAVGTTSGYSASGVRLTFAQPVAWDGSVAMTAGNGGTASPIGLYYNTGTTAAPTWATWTASSGVVTSTDFEVIYNGGVAGTLATAKVGYGNQFPAPLPSLVATKDRPVVGTPYSVSLDALMATASASGPETWALTSGTLPAGLSFDGSAGTISGTPTTPGDTVVTVTVTDARGIASAPVALTLSVQSSVLASTVYPSSATSVACGAYNANCSTSTPVPVATTYDASLASAVGTTSGNSLSGVRLTFAQPVTWDGSVAMTAGNGGTASPIGLYYNTGTTASPTWATWTAPNGVVTSTDFEVVFNGGVAGTLATAKVGYGNQFPTPLPSLTAGPRQLPLVGAAYSVGLDALLATTNASGPEAWSYTGTLPAGLSLDPVAGTISGTPTAAGDATVQVSVTDARGIASVPVPVLLSVQASVRASTAYPSSATSVGCGAVSPTGLCNAVVALPVATTYDASTVTAAPIVNSNYSGVRLTYAQPVAWDGSVTAATSVGAITPTNLFYNTGTTASPVWAPWTASVGLVSSTDFEVVYLSSQNALATARLGYGGQYPSALPSLTTPATVGTVVGIPYSASLSALAPATNLADAGAWSIASGSLPAGLTLGSDGTLSGTPTVGGSSTTATVTVADARGLPAVPVTLTVTVAPTAAAVYALSATNSTTANAVSVGGLYDASATTGTSLVAGGTLTLAFSGAVAWDGSLDAAFTGAAGTPQYNAGTTASPTWTNYASGVVTTTGIRFVASTAGTLSTLRAGFGGALPGYLPSGSAATVSVRPNVATSVSLDATLATTNVVGGEFWARYSGPLPTGLALDANSAGTLSGTPATEGTSVVYWTVKDSRGAYSDPIALTIAVQAQPVLSAGSDAASTSQAYKGTLAALTGASGLSTPTWGATGLPPGVTLATSTGALSGTPTTAGTYPVAVTVRNASGLSASATVTITVGSGTSTLMNGLVAYFPFSEGAGSTTTDAVAGYVITEAGTTSSLFATGKLGTGATVPSTATAHGAWGKLTGAAARSTSAWVKGTSGGTVVSWGTCSNGNDWYLDVTGTTLRYGACGASYDVTGNANVTDGAWHLLTATYDGSTIRAYADGVLVGSGTVGSISTSSSDLWVANRSDAPLGSAYALPYTGTVDEVGIWNRALSASEVASLYASGRGNAGPGFLGTAPTLSPATLGMASGAAVTTSLATATGAGNLQSGATWALTSGSFPTGLTMSSAGTLSGSSTAVGTTSAVVTVTNPDGSTNATSVTVTVAPAASGVLPTNATGSSGPATVGGLMDASATSGATVGAGGSVTLSYAQAVAWDGTLSTAFTGTAASPQYNAGTAAAPSWADYASGTVATTGIRFVAATAGTLGTFRPGYGGTLPPALPSLTAATTSTQGNAPVSGGLDALMATSNASGTEGWAIASGALPKGVTLSTEGVLGGAATSGTSTAYVTVTDARGVPSDPTALTVTVTPGPTLSPASLDGRVGLAAGSTSLATLMSATNLASPTWSVTGGGLPNGLSLSTAGLVTGTPTMAGTSSATVTVRVASGATTSASLSSTVLAALTMGTGGSYALRQGVPATIPAPSVGNAPVAPGTWSTYGGAALPAGLTLDPSTGVVSGAPDASLAGTTASVALTFADARGATASGTAPGYPESLSFYGPLSVGGTSDESGQIGVAFAGAAPSVAGTPISPSWTLGGTLPDGLSVDPGTGAVVGTPTTAGSATVTVTVTDATGGRATSDPFVVTVAPASTQAGAVQGADGQGG